MDRPSSAARRRTLDLPSKPENGLAEWTSKIKELQRQVDEDEEVEHRRLEEEIRASRMARLRRSGQSGSVDLSKSDLARMGSPPVSDSPSSPLARQQGQEDALRKLMGESRPSPSEPITSKTSKTPMSLAEFMGGRATGPRLTRHAPQQDAHDPTQFEQRTLKNIGSPHPIFGRGGVAMPGMVGRDRTPASPTPDPDEGVTQPSTASRVTGWDRKQSTPSIAQSVVQKVEMETVTTHKTGASVSSSYTRHRTISTPTGSIPVTSLPPSRTWDPVLQQQNNGTVSRAIPTFSPGLRSTTPGHDRHTPSKVMHTPPPVTSSPISRPSTSSRSPAPTSPTTSSSPKAAINTPSLARPIQPSPRASLGPQIPVSPNTSAAFLRAPPHKDPTPSLSRLQGRGFVKSMVQATAQLAAVPPSSPPPQEKKDSGGRKQASLFERWQNVAAPSSTPSPPPIISPKPTAMRESWTVDPSLASDMTPPRSVKSDYTGRSLKSASSVPSFDHSDVASSSAKSDAGGGSPRGRGLGSSTTMISYIKPIKTGDRSTTASPPPPRSRAASPEVDEMGMRVRHRSKSRHRSRSRHRSKSREAPREDMDVGRVVAGLPPAGAGKPLSHLTKDRAKKPRKARFAQNPVKEVHEVSSVVVAAKQIAQPGPEPPSQPESIASDVEVVVSLPPREDMSASQQELKPITLAKNGFEDDCVPSTAPPVANKPSQLSQLVMPKSPVIVTQAIASPATPNRGLTPSLTEEQVKDKPPASPARHTRIPSTGNRATVMDVAQALAAQTVFAQEKQEEDEVTETPPPDLKSTAANWSSRNGTTKPEPEARKSSYERYSAIVMPPLEEEKTPAPSPDATLARSSAHAFPEVIPEVETEATMETYPETVPPSVDDASAETVAITESQVIHIGHVNEPLPTLDAAALLNSGSTPYSPDADVHTISVDVMTIVGNVATAVSRDAHVFYDHDVLAIIHRAKLRSTGLVSSKVWAWQGKHSHSGEREERKLQGLARQYGTKLMTVQQYCEPAELVALLGGKLAIRQGSRSHWSPENTAMHLVRSLNGVILIDEVEIGIRNLCSAFSYCVSLLDTLYVWHGCGSINSERTAAREYAQSLASSSSSVVELVEGEADADDEMFWMILGDGDYARADYWKWRSSSPATQPCVWSVDSTKGPEAIQTVSSFADHAHFHHLVHLVDCVWEFFVVVGVEARGKRQDIKLALALATKLSEITSSSRPFTPTVHALVLPSQLPTDLRLHFRDLDEAAVNYGQIPDHMNLLSVHDAEEHLKTTTWERTLAKDPSMLPLGVQASDLR